MGRVIDDQSVNPEDDLMEAGVGSRGCVMGRVEGLPGKEGGGRPRKREDQKTTQRRREEREGGNAGRREGRGKGG